jgi:hypothetical protein
MPANLGFDLGVGRVLYVPGEAKYNGALNVGRVDVQS